MTRLPSLQTFFFTASSRLARFDVRVHHVAHARSHADPDAPHPQTSSHCDTFGQPFARTLPSLPTHLAVGYFFGEPTELQIHFTPCNSAVPRKAGRLLRTFRGFPLDHGAWDSCFYDSSLDDWMILYILYIIYWVGR